MAEKDTTKKTTNDEIKVELGVVAKMLGGMTKAIAKTPGTVVKMAGLGSGSPLAMMAGDKMNSLVNLAAESLHESILQRKLAQHERQKQLMIKGEVTDSRANDLASKMNNGINGLAKLAAESLQSTEEQKRIAQQERRSNIWANQDRKDEKTKRKTMAEYIKSQFYMLRDMKEHAEKSEKKNRSLLLLLLGAALFAAGMGVGGIAKAIILPFQMMVLAVNQITRMLSSILRLGGFFGMLRDFFSKIVRPFQALMQANVLTRMISTITTSIKGFTDIFGKFAAGFRLGFRLLGWPITLIMGIIDFVRGFREEQGSLWDKTKAGLIAAFTGFFEFPLKAIGWLVEKVGGFFGMEMEGTAQKIVEFGKKIIQWPFTFFENLYNYLRDTFAENGFFGGLNEIRKAIQNGLMEFVSAAIGWIPGVKSALQKIFVEGVSPTEVARDASNAMVEGARGMVDSASEAITGWTRNFFGGGRQQEQSQQTAQQTQPASVNTTAVVGMPDMTTRSDDYAMQRSGALYAN